MCGICGFYHSGKDFTERQEHYESLLTSMSEVLARRGPDDSGLYLSRHFGLSQRRLSIIDLVTGHQPIIRTRNSKRYGIVYNGELYNMNELKDDLIARGCHFETTSDTEVLLFGYMEYGISFYEKCNGIFAIAIMDEDEDSLYLVRDPMGVKPLFYTRLEKHDEKGTYLFSSELKGILAHPDSEAIINRTGMNEIFSLGPAKTPGCGVFQGIDEVLPGHFIKISPEGLKSVCYWQIEAHSHEDDYEKTVATTRELVIDAIKKQMLSDVPICTFLSGGIDSSIVSAVCSDVLKEKGKKLSTFAFDFVDNSKYFKASSFQPSEDGPFATMAAEYIGSDHHMLQCDKDSLALLLKDSVLAHDLPCMADVDSSMLYFCSIVKNHNKVVLTGECADEIFGGYPWFHKKELFSRDTFPWTPDLSPRKELLLDEFSDFLNMEDYVNEAYFHSLLEVPTLTGESGHEKRRREISYLNIRWFMQTLLDRMDRTSMYCGLEARVPFADTRIVQYLYNVPWEMKFKDGVVKGLLRDATKGLLPDEILYRKKSPYPKTYDPHYESLLAEQLKEVLSDNASPLLAFIDKKKVDTFLNAPSDYGKPWYGQLMAVYVYLTITFYRFYHYYTFHIMFVNYSL